MNIAVKKHPAFGRSLFADNGCVEIVIPLEFGLRIGHFSLIGEKNVFFEQPDDMTDLSTPDGWRVRCGHRLWLAPESDAVYYPDNAPISYEVKDNAIVLTQQEDPRLRVIKTMKITFGDGARLQVRHGVRNTAQEELRCSLWAVSAVAPGGVQTIPLRVYDGGAMPRHWISMWSYTNLGDHRAHYSPEEIRLIHEPIAQKYKIGVDRPNGSVRYENRGVAFVKEFPVIHEEVYPDKDVSYETFMCQHMVEMESLSPLMTIPSGETRYHTEVWHLTKLD